MGSLGGIRMNLKGPIKVYVNVACNEVLIPTTKIPTQKLEPQS